MDWPLRSRDSEAWMLHAKISTTWQGPCCGKAIRHKQTMLANHLCTASCTPAREDETQAAKHTLSISPFPVRNSRMSPGACCSWICMTVLMATCMQAAVTFTGVT